MTTIHRFIKDTIKSTEWHIQIEETNGDYILWKGLIRKDDYEIIKETTKVISESEAMKYMDENIDYCIETYRT